MKKGLYTSFLSLIFLVSCKETTTKTDKEQLIPQNIIDLEKRVNTSPDSTQLRLQLAMGLDSIGNTSKALQQMDSLIKKDSANYGLWYTKGNFYEHIKDTLQALNAYLKAASIYPSADALLSAGNIYAEQSNNKALQVSKQILLMRLGREYDAHAHFIAGVYLARIGDKAAAVTALDKCISNNYTYMEAYIEKGLVYFDAKDYTKALSIFTFASNVNNLYADAYYYMARCYELMGKKDSAILRFQQSLALDKNLKEAEVGIKRLENK